MNCLKTVLVGVDFSPCSEGAFRQAARVAAWNGAALSALHVIALPAYVPTPHRFISFDLPTQADFVPAARAQWERFASGCDAAAGVTLDIEIGSPRERILDRVLRDKPDLLVLGSHSVLDAAKGVGPTAAALVQGAATKVLLVRAGHAGAFRNIVACIDFTDTSLLALEQAIRTATQDDAALHVLHVYDDPWCGWTPPAGHPANMPDHQEQYRRAVQDRLRAFCEPLAHEFKSRSPVFHVIESEWRGGGYGHAVVAFVKRNGCDLAVLGTRAKWNLRDFLWGSTAERVVRSAHCSILAVKSREVHHGRATDERSGTVREPLVA
ncbi:MAG: universal stress protein [Phycisphaerales bacterium]